MSKVILASTVAAILLNYEVKFNLDPSIVVDASHNLIRESRQHFNGNIL
ncbi:hypothetical protein [Paenibacillus alginolyticus]|nr:hypothetical protein [Paenibacillus alginolyticus]MEC0145922.1 hypothetical protein [Paenibacillus alginolyticus]